jgi:hypothetical protein
MTREAILKRLGLLPEIVICFRRAVRHSGGRPISVARLMLRTLGRGYWPLEAYRLGLLHPGSGPAMLEVHQSKRAMVRIQRRLNPAAWEPLLADKGIFYRFFSSAGFPVPQLFGIYIRGGKGWIAGSPPPSSDGEWERFLETMCPDKLVIKPTQGRHGKGVLFLTRSGSGFNTPDGASHSATALVELMNSEREYDSFVIQERMRNHPGLAPVVAGEGLVTSRIITFCGAAGKCEILNADLKLVMGKNLTSKLSMGATGNMAAAMSVSGGYVEQAVRVVDGEGFVEVERHPETGALLKGFRPPDWESACALAFRAAAAVLPIRTVGWDVAFTPAGPVLLEGNFFFDPPNSTFRGRHVSAILGKGI